MPKKIQTLEELSKKIFLQETKLLFNEVLDNYNKAYCRSALVTLWSVSVFDIVQKIELLAEGHGDTNAERIMQEIRKIQKNDIKDTSWENKLPDWLVKYQLAESSESVNLKELQKERHLSAHPIILNEERKLYVPDLQKVENYIRKILETFLVKPPTFLMITRDLIQKLAINLSKTKGFYLEDIKRLENDLDENYLMYCKPEQISTIFRSFWKFVFKAQNPEEQENLAINSVFLGIIARKYKDSLNNFVAYYGQKTYKIEYLADTYQRKCLMNVLFEFPSLWEKLEKPTQENLREFIKDDINKFSLAYFLSQNIKAHLLKVSDALKNDASQDLNETTLLFLAQKWQEHGLPRDEFLQMIIGIFHDTSEYTIAENRYKIIIIKYLDHFTESQLEKIVQAINKNKFLHSTNSLSYREKIRKVGDVKNHRIRWEEYQNFNTLL